MKGLKSRLPAAVDPLAFIAGLALVVAAIELVAGALSVGVTADEPWHVFRSQSLLDDGWYVIATEGGNVIAGPTWSPYVYGPGFSLPAHFLASTLGIEQAGRISEDAAAYGFRHLMVAFLALLTALGVWASVRVLTRSSPAAIWAAAALLCIPVWLGMGMFNVKDVPVATGYTLLTTALVLSLTLREPVRPRRLFVIASLCAIGVLLSVGVRLGMWVAIAASLATWLGLLAAKRQLDGEWSRGVLVAVLGGSVIGLGAIALLYPQAFSSPVQLAMESVSISADYPYKTATLTAGAEAPSNPAPLWYFPVWTIAVTPFLIGLLAVAGAASWIGDLASAARRSRLRRFLTGRQAPVLLVGLQLALLPAGAMLTGATAYSGIRQILFIVPAIAVFAGLGLARLQTSGWLDSKKPAWRRRVLTVVAGLALIVPLAEQTRLFPFNYAYVNPVAGIGGIEGRWATDFWWASNREVAGLTAGGDTVLCPGDLFFLSFSDCPEHTAEFLPARTVRFDPSDPPQQSVKVLVPAFDLKYVPPYCQIDGTVTRSIRLERVALSRVLACDPERVAATYRRGGTYNPDRLARP